MSIAEFILDEDGLTVVEYVVAAGLISLALSGFFTNLIDLMSRELFSLFSGT